MPDLVGAPQGLLSSGLPLAGIRKAIAVAAKKIVAVPMQLGNRSPAVDSIHHAGTDEIRPYAAEAALHPDNADGLRHVLPRVASNARAVREMQPVCLGTQGDGSDRLAL